jgi:hypothetical protein
MARFMVVWNAAVTCGLAVVVCKQLVAPAGAAPKLVKLDELDVQRINIVEPDGKPRMILASAARYPGVFWAGKEYPHPGRAKGGLLYFNDDGTEAGGLGYSDDRAAKQASGGLTFDQYEQDQTLALQYEQEGDKRAAGLVVWDRPQKPLLPLIVAAGAIDAAKSDADRAAATKRAEAVADDMGESAVRLFAGKRQDDAMLELYDKRGVPRLRLQVDGSGAPSLEFLDASGKPIARLPDHR